MYNVSNRQVIVGLYQAFFASDPDPELFPFNGDSVWREPGDNARSGVFRGQKEIADHAANCRQLTDGTWGTDVVEILGGDKYVVVVERALAMRNGMSLNMLCSTIYEMADGFVNEMRVLPFDPEAWNTFWS